MKVICRKIIDLGITREMGKKARGISVGTEYVVLALMVKPHSGVSIWIINDEVQPSIYDLVGFEVLTQKIPSRWTYHTDEYHHSFLMPPGIYESNFFDDFHNGSPQAAEWFCQEAALTYAEEGEPFNYIDEDFYLPK